MTLRPRFQNTGKSTFFGDFVYERIVPKDHFLVALENLFDWETISQELIGAYRGRGLYGRPPYDPAQIFKMLFISYLYGVSEREVEQLVSYHLVVKWFVGLAVDEPAPDHSTLTVFKDRFLGEDTWGKLVGCFDDLLQQAREQGLEIGHIQILDSVHTQADVNLEKERKRQDQGQPPRDPDARVVNKGRREVVEPDGRRTQKEIRYQGYKLIVLRTKPTSRSTRRPAWLPAFFPPGETGPTTGSSPTCWPTIKPCNCPPTPMVATGPITRMAFGHDDTDIHERLEAAGLHSGIGLRRFRTEKKDPNTDTALHVQRALDSPPSHARIPRSHGAEIPCGTGLWPGQAEAWLGALPLYRTAKVQNSIPIHLLGSQLQTYGQAAHRVDLPTTGQGPAVGGHQAHLCLLTLGVVRLSGEGVRYERPFGSDKGQNTHQKPGKGGAYRPTVI